MLASGINVTCMLMFDDNYQFEWLSLLISHEFMFLVEWITAGKFHISFFHYGLSLFILYTCIVWFHYSTLLLLRMKKNCETH
jgi:hypothetical protein